MLHCGKYCRGDWRSENNRRKPFFFRSRFALSSSPPPMQMLSSSSRSGRRKSTWQSSRSWWTNAARYPVRPSAHRTMWSSSKSQAWPNQMAASLIAQQVERRRKRQQRAMTRRSNRFSSRQLFESLLASILKLDESKLQTHTQRSQVDECALCCVNYLHSIIIHWPDLVFMPPK